ncbi:MAG: hypothetical protein N2515_06980 [Deltaproteobacteria bacterium]|nr:hypothetical protein [Deltaproteobacteria bacterium]
MPVSHLLLHVIMGCAACLLPPVALAQAGARIGQGEVRFGGLRAQPDLDARIVQESLQLDCEKFSTRIRCNAEAKWLIASDHFAVGRVYATTHGLEGAVLEAGPIRSEEPSVHPIAIGLPPQGSTQLTLRGAFSLSYRQEMLHALEARHPLLSTGQSSLRAEAQFIRAVGDTFAAGADFVEITLSTPPSKEQDFKLSVQGESIGPKGVRIPAFLPNAPRSFTLEFTPRNSDIFRHGGPFLAVGGTFEKGLRAQLGYELGWGSFLLTSIAADTDFQSDLTLSLAAEAGTPSLLFIPSLALGVGPIYRVLLQTPERSPWGVRFSLSAVPIVAGFTAAFDWFPEGGETRVSLFGRLSL